MKPHLPFSLLRALMKALLAPACLAVTISSANAIVMDSQFDVKTYRDFAENRGRFAAGNTNIPIWDKSGNIVGFVANTDTNPGISMINFDGVSDTSGRHTLIDYQITTGCGHVTSMERTDIIFGQRFGQEQKYRVISDVLNPNYDSGVDVRVQRLSRIVTTAAPISVMTDMDMINRLINNQLTVVRVGRGEHRISGTDYNTKYGSQWLAGGVVEIIPNSKSPGQTFYYSGTDYLRLENIFKDHIKAGDADKYPLPLGMQNGDSGSPAFAWNDKLKKWQFIGTNTHYSPTTAYGSTHEIRGAPLWTVRQANSYNDSLNPIAGGSEITFKYEDGSVASGARNIKVYQNGQYMLATTGATNAYGTSWKDRNTFIAPANEAKQHRGIIWGPQGGVIRLTNAGTNPLGLLDFGAGSWTFQGDYIIEADSGYLRWNTNTGWKEAYLQYSVCTGGFIVEAGCTLTMRTTGRSASLGIGYDEWRKTGSGTLRIEGSGNNGASLDVGGDGLVVLSRTGGYAAENILINGGYVRVVLEKENQINTLSFGFRGGYLDLNGQSLAWNSINHSDDGAKIVNFGKGLQSVFTYSGTGYYKGSFMDNGSLANGLLKVVYNGTGAWTLTGISNNRGGYEINGGTVTVSGSNTLHAGSQFNVGSALGQNDQSFYDPDDWHYAQMYTSDIVLNNGATFVVGHHSRVDADITVNSGTFQITEGVFKSKAEAIDGYQKGVIDPSLYGHTGTVNLKGSTANFVANISNKTDTALLYKGEITGNGNFVKKGVGTLWMEGDNKGFSGTKSVQEGMLVLSESAIGDTSVNRWKVDLKGIIAFDGINSNEGLLHIDSSSTGTFALTSDQFTQLDFSAHSGLTLGAYGTVNYGETGTTEQMNSFSGNQWRLGGGGGNLIVNYQLSGKNDLIIGNGIILTSPSKVHLSNINNDFVGKIVINAGSVLSFDDTRALGNASNTLSIRSGGGLDVQGKSLNYSMEIAGTGDGKSPWALLNSSEDGGYVQSVKLTGNATIGGLNGTLTIGALNLNSYTLTFNGGNLFANGTTLGNGNILLSGQDALFHASNVQKTGTITISGGASLILSDSNNSSLSGLGSIVVNSGKISTEGSAPAILGNGLNLTGNTVLSSSQNALLTLTGQASGAGNVSIEGRVGLWGNWLNYTGQITVNADSTLDMGTRSSNSFNAGSILLSGTITGNTSTVFHNAQKINGTGTINDICLSYSGNASVTHSITGGASIAVESGTVGLHGENTSTGGVVLNGGRLELDGGSSRLGSGTTVVNTGATLVTLGSGAINGDNSAANRQSLLVKGGDVILAGTEYLHSLAFEGGTISGTPGKNSSLAAAESGLALSSTAHDSDASVTVNIDLSHGNLRLDAERGSSDTDISISSGISGNASANSGSVEKYGEGTIELSGINTYTGATAIREGTLRLTRQESAGKGDITVDSGATLELSGSNWINKSFLSQSLLNNGTLLLNDANVKLNNLSGLSTGDITLNNSQLILSSNSAASGKNLTLSGSSALTFTLSSNGPNDTPMLNLSGNLTLGEGARLDFAFDDGTSPMDGNYLLINAKSFTGNVLGSLSSGIYRGSYSLFSEGTGIYLNVSGASMVALTWSGAANKVWEVNGANNWVKTGEMTADKFYSKDIVSFGDEGTGNITVKGRVLASSVVINSSGNYNFTGDSTDGGIITVAGGMEKSGTGILTLSSDNLIDTSELLLKEGGLELTAANALGNTLLVISNKSALLNSHTTADRNVSANIRINGAASFEARTRNLILDGNIDLNGSSAEIAALGTGSVIVNGKISNGTDLIKSGSGTLDVRSGLSVQTLTLSEGTLAIAQETTLGSSVLRMEGGRLLMSESAFATANGATRTQWNISNRIDLSGTSSLAVNSSSTNALYKNCAFNLSGVISVSEDGATLNSANNLILSGTGSGGVLTKTGNSVLTVNGNFSGISNLVVSEGELVLGAAASLPRFELGSNAFIKLVSGRLFSQEITGTGSIIVDIAGGSSTLFSNANSKSFNGTIQIKSGRIEAPSSYLSSSARIVVNNGGQITMNGEVLNNLTLSGTGWNASADAAKAAALRLSGALVKGSISIADSAQIGVYTSDIASRIDGAITGGNLIKTMAGLLSLNADAQSTYSSLTINGGVIRIEGGEGGNRTSTALGKGVVSINAQTRLQFAPGKEGVEGTYTFGNNISLALGGALEGILGSTRLTGLITVDTTTSGKFNNIRVLDKATLDFAGGIAGSGDILFNDDTSSLGTFRVSGKGGHTGKWILQRGNLYIDSNTAISSVSELVLQTADLYINASDVSINKLTTEKEAGIHATGSGQTLTLKEGDIQGNLDGDLLLVLKGSSSQTLTLAGSNSHSGGTSVESGKLILTGAKSAGVGDMEIAYGASVEFKDWATPQVLSAGMGIYNRGTLRMTNVSSLSVNRQLHSGILSGEFIMDNSTLEIVESGSMTAGAFRMLNGSVLNLNMDDSLFGASAITADSFSFEAGSTLNVIFGSGAVKGKTYQLLSSSSEIDWSGLSNMGISIPGSRYDYTWNKTSNSLSITINDIFATQLVWNPAAENNRWTKAANNQNWVFNGTSLYFMNDDTVLFTETGAGSVLIGENVAASKINVSGGNYSFTSDGGEMTGRGTLSISGTDTILTLNSSNSYSGGTTISDGASLNAVSAGSLGSGNLVIGKGNATLSGAQNISLVELGDGTLAASAENALGKGTLRIKGGTANISASQNIIDVDITGGVTNATAATALGKGDLSVSGGILNISAAQSLTSGVIKSGGKVVLSSTGNLGTGRVTLEEGGNLTIMGVPAYNALQNGKLAINGGTLRIDGNKVTSNIQIDLTSKLALGGKGVIELTNGSFENTGFGADFTSDIYIGENGQLRVHSNWYNRLKGSIILNSMGNPTLNNVGKIGALKMLSNSAVPRVRLASDSAIAVWVNESARVDELDGAGFNLTKTNGGTLVISRLSGSINNLTIKVEDANNSYGNVVFNSIDEGKSINSVTLGDTFSVKFGESITSLKGTTFTAMGTAGTAKLVFQQTGELVASGIKVGTASNRLGLEHSGSGDTLIDESVGTMFLSTLAKSGENALTLSCVADLTKDVTISAGTLRLKDQGVLKLAASSKIVNNGTLEYSILKDYTLSNAVTGTGRVYQSGSGVLTLSSASNSFSGGLEASSGVIRGTSLAAYGKGKLIAGGTGKIDLAGFALTNEIVINSDHAEIANYSKYNGTISLAANWTQKESLISSVVVNVENGGGYNMNNLNSQHTVNYLRTDGSTGLSGYGNFTGTLNVYGELALDGNFHGALVARNGGSAVLASGGNADHANIRIEQGGSFMVDSGSIYTVTADSRIVNDGTFLNKGTVQFSQGLNTSTAYYQGSGSLVNDGTIDLGSYYTLGELGAMTSNGIFSGSGSIVNIKSSEVSEPAVDITGNITLENNSGTEQTQTNIGTVSGTLNIGAGLDVKTENLDGGTINVNKGSTVTVSGETVSGNVQASGGSIVLNGGKDGATQQISGVTSANHDGTNNGDIHLKGSASMAEGSKMQAGSISIEGKDNIIHEAVIKDFINGTSSLDSFKGAADILVKSNNSDPAHASLNQLVFTEASAKLTIDSNVASASIQNIQGVGNVVSTATSTLISGTITDIGITTSGMGSANALVLDGVTIADQLNLTTISWANNNAHVNISNGLTYSASSTGTILKDGLDLTSIFRGTGTLVFDGQAIVIDLSGIHASNGDEFTVSFFADESAKRSRSATTLDVQLNGTGVSTNTSGWTVTKNSATGKYVFSYSEEQNVPEPSSSVLVLFGLAAPLLRRKRARH